MNLYCHIVGAQYGIFDIAHQLSWACATRPYEAIKLLVFKAEIPQLLPTGSVLH